MASKTTANGSSMSFPTATMIFCSIVSAFISGGSFWLIKYWPLPQSVEPYFGFDVGCIWGAVIGAVFGFILGFLTDERHFAE
jgi:hypothetical protein